jgi:hypothetical protein
MYKATKLGIKAIDEAKGKVRELLEELEEK